MSKIVLNKYFLYIYIIETFFILLDILIAVCYNILVRRLRAHLGRTQKGETMKVRIKKKALKKIVIALITVASFIADLITIIKALKG